MVFCIILKLIVGFAVVGVINAVFMQETFKVANTDDHIMVRMKQRAANQHRKKITHLFAWADKDKSGSLGRTEFKEVLQDPHIKTWLASMDFVASDTDLLFDMIADGDDSVTAEELINGIGHLKGASRAIDMRSLKWKLDE